MPEGGLYRAGRWADVTVFPAPAKDITSRIHTPGPPLIDGYPRWEDAYGRFATAKFSATDMAAIGRTVAGYRRYVSEGTNFFDKVKGWLSEPDDESEPLVLENRIPPSYFEDAHLLHLEYDPEPCFINVDHPQTVRIIEELVGATLDAIGATVAGGISQNRDRRVTRLAMATLYNLCVTQGFDRIAGIRYAAPEPEWDAYVFWSPPRIIDLADALPVPVFPDDDAVREAAERLGLEPPH